MNPKLNSNSQLKKPYQKVELRLFKIMLTVLILFSCESIAFSAGFQSPETISGLVADSKGETLIGVSVKIKNSSIGTVTDQNGKYSIKVPDANAVLVFSYIGYITQEIAVANQTSIKVTMAEQAKSLNDVVVVGYATQKR